MGVAVPVAAFGVVRDWFMPGVSTVFDLSLVLPGLALGTRPAPKCSFSGNARIGLDVDVSYIVLVNVGVGRPVLENVVNSWPLSSNFFGQSLDHEAGGTSAISAWYGILYCFPGTVTMLKSTPGLSTEI